MIQSAPEEQAPTRFWFSATQSLDRLKNLLLGPLAKPAEIDTTPIPTTNVRRRRASSFAASLDQDETLQEKISTQQEHGIAVSDTGAKEETVLYLAYGSNLASKTFRGVRGIRPISQICVFVPELRLTFDLPGIPYAEPCFAGTQYKDVPSTAASTSNTDIEDETDTSDTEYLSEKATLISKTEAPLESDKRRWHKPLVGVVYEVTLADYAKIIATEGGGRGYRDGVIDCHPFPENYDPSAPVPDYPDTPAFKAHTLLSPAADDARLRSQSKKGIVLPSTGPKLKWWHTICLHFRPDPEYAQPSARYLGLIKTGAAEHNLPISYQEYLAQIGTFHITTTRQKIGKVIFLVMWAPGILTTMALGRIFAGPDGRSPPWVVVLANVMFSGLWKSYDGFFARVFGDGERTLDDTPA
ncbi:uncharacterized protein N7515_002039 [Penicillium bovifimosum]|uniref:gamma-glutamylcyclotransferase n=1 Tax=Penicillium bovifimosum TaxID=126998 RepID=A0A9W9L9B5_9EURO|nr:uncharacterized protein N7515_002039 [Penicillium bovifimosum]KAJ5143252.1 hypothetical protein N7515_002039 [Penicillium bovifimosum]